MMDSVTITALFFIIVSTLLLWFRSCNHFVKTVNKIPGPFAVPLLGNILIFLRGYTPVTLFQRTIADLPAMGTLVRLWMFEKAQILIYTARDAEVVLKDMKHHVKSENYNFLRDWMGQGLLTSRDDMWRVHRKVLTPAFHFNILHEFIPIFNKHAFYLAESLAKETTTATKEGFNIFPYSSLCSLNIICESSMGKDLKAQDNTNIDYVNSIHSVNELLTHRYFTPWLRPDCLFNISSTKRFLDQHLKLINDFTDQVISERRHYLKSIKKDEESYDTIFGKRRRLAFLDLLLTAEAEGSQFMTQKDIRDQVSTFMFEGHDTVSTATCWVLFILGTYPEVQQRVVEELEEVFGDSGRAPDMTDLANLKYLERCIKETLRLYPSVPFFERQIETDAQLDRYLIPAGCTVSFIIYLIHREPEFWPDPEKFDPDRFTPENSQGRHPYSYLPFSAGPRNCIGQKFALLEEKVVVSTVLRRFRVEAVQSRDEANAQLQMAMVLRPNNGLNIRLYDRNERPNLKVVSTLPVQAVQAHAH